MSDTVLTRRELNRALLARQLLLERATLDPLAAIEHLVAVQAQEAEPPHLGLWARLSAYHPDEVADLLAQRRLVRAPFVRAAAHLVSARDLLRLAVAVQPALERATRGLFGEVWQRVDVPRLVEVARAALASDPLTDAELGAVLAAHAPDEDPAGLTWAVATALPLVHLPPAGTWDHDDAPRLATAADWLEAEPASVSHEATLLWRYLAAYGPAGVVDMQAFTSMTRQQAVLPELRPHLEVLRDERGLELFDVPGAPRPAGDEPAPPRLLPAYDNVLMAHDDRSRIIPPQRRPRVFRAGARVQPTLLIDGFVAGTWRIDRAPDHVRVVLEPFALLAEADRAGLLAEADRMLALLALAGESTEVEVADPA